MKDCWGAGTQQEEVSSGRGGERSWANKAAGWDADICLLDLWPPPPGPDDGHG